MFNIFGFLSIIFLSVFEYLIWTLTFHGNLFFTSVHTHSSLPNSVVVVSNSILHQDLLQVPDDI